MAALAELTAPEVTATSPCHRSPVGLTSAYGLLEQTPSLQSAGLAIEASGRLPGWFPEFYRSGTRLLDLQPGWDSYGGRRVELEALGRAIVQVVDLNFPGMPAPAVVPLGSGGVQLEWHGPGGELVLGFEPGSAATEFYWSDAGTSEELVVLPPSPPEIREYVRRVFGAEGR